MTRSLLALPLLLLAACAAEDAQPDRPTAWNLSGPLVETTGDGCTWDGGDAIDLDLIGLGGGDTVTAPDDDRISCGAPEDVGDAWRIGCDIFDETQVDIDGDLDIEIAKSDGAGSLVWAWDGCTFAFDVVATDI